MRSKLSIRRRGDSIYLKFMGNFDCASSGEVLHALKKMVLSSLEFSNPGSEVCFTFKTHARVVIDRELEQIGLGGLETAGAGARQFEKSVRYPAPGSGAF